MTYTYTCDQCQWKGDTKQFDEKVVDIRYRHRASEIQAYVKIVCPVCRNMVVMLYEFFDAAKNRA